MSNSETRRRQICDEFVARRGASPSEQAALDEWIDGAPLVLRYRFELADGEDGSVSAMVSGGVTSSGFLDLHTNVYTHAGVGTSSSPMEALRIGSLLVQAAQWCLSTAAVLEYAALVAGIPARCTSGASGLARYCTWHRVLPTMPAPYPRG